MRMMRRAGLLEGEEILKLEKLFKEATISAVGVNSSITRRLSFTLKEGKGYLFSICNGYIGIWKFINGNIQTSYLNKSSDDYGGITNFYGTWYYYNGNYSTTFPGSNINGATIATITFLSNIDDNKIDELFFNMTINRIKGCNTNTLRSINTNDQNNKIYLTAKGGSIDFWLPNGTTYIKISGTSTPAASTSGSNLDLGSVYGGSIIGFV